MPSNAVKVSKNPDTNWQNTAVQFPRFIAEAEAAGAFTEDTINQMAWSMDLPEREIYILIDRACEAWDAIKSKT
jgi:hypothetical protein